jgi:nucleoside-diphosphate-sugar epimerase
MSARQVLVPGAELIDFTRLKTQGPVLVTGGSGFIGRHLVSALRAQRIPVRVLVRDAETSGPITSLGAEVVIGDMVDPGAVRRAAAGIRAVFHLAGRLFAPGVPFEYYERLHVGGTAALLRACEGQPVDFFVHCSTTGVHGPTGSVPPAEDDAGHPQNAYETTKAQAERVAADIARDLGLPLVVARPGLVYGPGDLHLLGWFRAIRAGYYRVIGPGTNRFHPIYIEDLVRSLLLCANTTAPAGRAYHLVGCRSVTMRELSDAIGEAVGRPVPRRHLPAPLALAVGTALEALPVSRRRLPLTRSRVRFMLQNRAYDGSRAASELGFVPTVDLAEGLRRTVDWYQAQGLL